MRAAASSADVHRVLVEVLTPYIGRNIADASVKGYLARLGQAVTSVSPEDAEKLLGWIKPGLKVFIGEARTNQVVAELQQALERLEEAK